MSDSVYPEVFDQWKRPKPNPEFNSGEVMVETAGYVPAEIQIQEMLLAGERLGAARRIYEFGPDEEVPEGYYDPTRAPNFDLADASLLAQATEARLKEQLAAKEERDKKTEEEKQKIQEAKDKLYQEWQDKQAAENEPA